MVQLTHPFREMITVWQFGGDHLSRALIISHIPERCLNILSARVKTHG